MQRDEPNEKATTESSGAWTRVQTGANQVWNWVTYPWTLGASHTADLVDSGPVGQQLRSLDGRTQVHSTAIEIMSAQLTDIARDQSKIFQRLEQHDQSVERIGAELRAVIDLSRSLPLEFEATRDELFKGVRRVQLSLAEETASLRSSLAQLPSIEQIRALFQEQMEAQIKHINDRLASLPTSLDLQTHVSEALAQQLTETRTQSSGEAQSLKDSLSHTSSAILDRMAVMPSRQDVNAIVESAIERPLTATRLQLSEEIQNLQHLFAKETADAQTLLAMLPSTEKVQALVSQAPVIDEIAAVKFHTTSEAQRIAAELMRAMSSIHDRLATLPLAEDLPALVVSAVVPEIATTRAQMSEVINRVHQSLLEQKRDVHERLSGLPTIEQIHASIEGGTANNIQSTRRILAEEAHRAQSAADRVAKKLEFLQSRSVVPLSSQGMVMCRNPMGFLAVPVDDVATIGSLADGVLPEQGTLKVINRFLKPGDTFVDVGANVGLFSLLASRVVGPTGKVIAIEPAPVTIEALRTTVRANGLAGIVTIKEVAAGAEQGLGTLAVTQNSTHNSLLATDASANSVVSLIAPLDEIVGTTIPDMVKIDVEGWEPQVLEGMKSILQTNPNLIVIMDFEPAHIRRTGISAATWVQRMLSAGLHIFEIDERNGELTELRKSGLEEIVSINVLIARRDPSHSDADAPTEGWLRIGAGAPSMLP